MGSQKDDVTQVVAGTLILGLGFRLVVDQGWISRKVLKHSTEIRFMLIPFIVLFIAHEFITGDF